MQARIKGSRQSKVLQAPIQLLYHTLLDVLALHHRPKGIPKLKEDNLHRQHSTLCFANTYLCYLLTGSAGDISVANGVFREQDVIP